MSMSIGKRQIVLATLVVALGAAVFVNWYYTKPDAEKANTGVTVTEEVTQAAGNLGDALLVNSSSVSSQSNTKETKAQQAQAQVEDEYFAQARLNRSTAHDKGGRSAQKNQLKDSKSSSEAVKNRHAGAWGAFQGDQAGGRYGKPNQRKDRQPLCGGHRQQYSTGCSWKRGIEGCHYRAD